MDSYQPPQELFGTDWLDFGALADGSRVSRRVGLRMLVTDSGIKQVHCELRFKGADDFVLRRWWGIYF
jgi:hypothetical protein